jgi:Family of unknown function (DUF5681)
MKTSKEAKRPAGTVGYGRPPPEHKFKKGASGNPKGRPKGAKNEATILRALLNRKIQLRQDGKSQSITVLEAMLLKIADEALKGNPKAAAFLLDRYAPVDAVGEDRVELDPDDQQILESFARRLEEKINKRQSK